MLEALALNPFMSVQLLLVKGSKVSSNTQHVLHFLRVSPDASSRKVIAMIQRDHDIVSGYSAIENRESQNGFQSRSRSGSNTITVHRSFGRACGVLSSGHLALVRC